MDFKWTLTACSAKSLPKRFFLALMVVHERETFGSLSSSPAESNFPGVQESLISHHMICGLKFGKMTALACSCLMRKVNGRILAPSLKTFLESLGEASLQGKPKERGQSQQESPCSEKSCS